MRTTLDIDSDILLAAKELATKQKSTTGKVISELARRALTRKTQSARRPLKNAIPLIRSRGDVITLDHVKKLMEQGGV